ncbi:hypothetical protein D3C76_1145640 [compost metagenome]
MLTAGIDTQRVERDGKRLVFDTQRLQRAMVDLQLRGVVALRPGQRQPEFVHLMTRLVIQGRQPQMRLGQRSQAIVHARIDIHNVAVLFDGLDSWQETRALQTVAIKVVRRNVRRRHQRNSARKQRFHQAAQQHGVGDIGDKKLIETQNVGFGFKSLGDDIQRIAVPLQGVQLFMDAQHKAVEMQTLFTRTRQTLVKHVHQPGFPSTNTAPHI